MENDEIDYDDEIMQNRERNRALLASLGLGGPLLPPVKKSALKKPRITKKRKASDTETENQDAEPRKSSRVDGTTDATVDETGLRRSGRNHGKTIDYKGENVSNHSMPRLASANSTLKETGTEPRSVNKRIHDPKVFGAIPGIAVGTWWLTREECSANAIHAPWVAGISGGPDGAYSVALSGGYEDDVDLGEAFTYTGAGGRDLKGTKKAPKNLRTAPQSSDQSFDNRLNSALKKSCETRKPIRVIRGYKLKSSYAPAEGYRYDGLYTVEKAWMEKGLNPQGWKVCKFAFKRVPGQAPLKLNDGPDSDMEAGDEHNDTREDSVEAE